jgi:hypothetical protein
VPRNGYRYNFRKGRSIMIAGEDDKKNCGRPKLTDSNRKIFEDAHWMQLWKNKKGKI